MIMSRLPLQGQEGHVQVTPLMRHRAYIPDSAEVVAHRKASRAGDVARALSVASSVDRKLSDPYGHRGSVADAPLSRWTAAAYSVGHFLNDACASVW